MIKDLQIILLDANLVFFLEINQCLIIQNEPPCLPVMANMALRKTRFLTLVFSKLKDWLVRQLGLIFIVPIKLCYATKLLSRVGEESGGECCSRWWGGGGAWVKKNLQGPLHDPMVWWEHWEFDPLSGTLYTVEVMPLYIAMTNGK